MTFITNLTKHQTIQKSFSILMYVSVLLLRILMFNYISNKDKDVNFVYKFRKQRIQISTNRMNRVPMQIQIKNIM